MSEQLTEEQTIRFHDEKLWEPLTDEQRARFQIEQDRLCMPFSVFHKAIEVALGRSVYTHEFGLNRDGLRSELNGERSPMTFAEVIDLIPTDKTVIVVTP